MGEVLLLPEVDVGPWGVNSLFSFFSKGDIGLSFGKGDKSNVEAGNPVYSFVPIGTGT